MAEDRIAFIDSSNEFEMFTANLAALFSRKGTSTHQKSRKGTSFPGVASGEQLFVIPIEDWRVVSTEGARILRRVMRCLTAVGRVFKERAQSPRKRSLSRMMVACSGMILGQGAEFSLSRKRRLLAMAVGRRRRSLG